MGSFRLEKTSEPIESSHGIFGSKGGRETTPKGRVRPGCPRNQGSPGAGTSWEPEVQQEPREECQENKILAGSRGSWAVQCPEPGKEGPGKEQPRFWGPRVGLEGEQLRLGREMLRGSHRELEELARAGPAREASQEPQAAAGTT